MMWGFITIGAGCLFYAGFVYPRKVQRWERELAIDWQEHQKKAENSQSDFLLWIYHVYDNTLYYQNKC